LATLAVFLFGYATAVTRSRGLYAGGNGKDVALLINDSVYVRSYTKEHLPDPPTALGLLETVTRREGLALEVDRSSSLGAFVKQITDRKNGQDTLYWQYYVDGQQPMVAADKYELRGGETVLWTFSKSAM
jgi:hypothetical protein